MKISNIQEYVKLSSLFSKFIILVKRERKKKSRTIRFFDKNLFFKSYDGEAEKRGIFTLSKMAVIYRFKLTNVILARDSPCVI